MSILKSLAGGQGYAKFGFLGFPKSGKSYTATLLAIGIRKHFGLAGPIAMFDTEGGSSYLAPMVKKETGQDLVGIRSRAFSDLMTTAKECEAGGASVLIADSISHVWRELGDAYMKQINQIRTAKNMGPKTRMGIQEIMNLKNLWAPWPDYYLNSKLHIIVCGRAGFEWDQVEDPETGEMKLTKTGIKMKVESEFGFEPSCLCELERVQEDRGGKTIIKHRATVLGDRFGVIDAAQCDNPTFDFFKPHIDMLKAGAHCPVDVEVKTSVDVDESGDAAFSRERRARTILAEEIQGELVARWPGQSKEEKQAKADALFKLFQTRSWTAVENMDSARLRAGLTMLRDGDVPSVAAEPEPVGAASE